MRSDASTPMIPFFSNDLPRRWLWTATASDTLLQYGFIPINLLNQLRDSRNWKARASGIEELQRLVTSLTNIGAVVPHLPSFMELCAGLLSDQNFKISLTVNSSFMTSS